MEKGQAENSMVDEVEVLQPTDYERGKSCNPVMNWFKFLFHESWGTLLPIVNNIVVWRLNSFFLHSHKYPEPFISTTNLMKG